MKRKFKKISFKVEGGYVPTKIEDIHQHLQEINRGVGSPRPRKGRGSYTRKEKYK